MARIFKSSFARSRPFSVYYLKSLKPADRPYEISEPGGLRVIVGKRTKTFVLRYISPATKKNRKLTIGQFPGKSLLDARAELAAARQLISNGSDPAGLKLKSRVEKKHVPTIQELSREYLEWLPSGKKSRIQDEYYIGRIVKRWGTVKVWAITRRDVLDLVADQGEKFVTASHYLTHLRKMLSFALDREYIQANPADGVRAPGTFQKRSRFLSDAEIKTFWKGSYLLEARQQIGMMLRLELVTGQRQGEIRQLERGHLDLENAVWTIPETISKNGRAHLVPLSPLASSILTEALDANKGDRFIFPGRKDGPLSKGTLGQAIRRNKAALPLANFRPHDLRRTCATGLGALGVDRLIIQKVLNHTDRSVTGIYDRWEYLQEKRTALARWAETIACLVSRDKHEVDVKTIGQTPDLTP